MFIGLDIGTSGTKVVLIDAEGSVRAVSTHGYPLSTPRPQWSEQDPAHWWEAAVLGIRAVLAEAGIDGDAVAAVGLTGQMHGLVLLDEEGEVVRPALLWNDQRTAAQCDAIHERVGRERVVAITGKPALTGFTAPKVLWVRDEEPDAFAAARHMLLPKDYVRYRLSGALMSDVADASGTSLFDIARRRWSDEMLDALDISRSLLPEVTESPVPSSAISAGAAMETGLRPGTPVIAGAGDQAAEAVGCGIVREGAVSVAIGTSGVVFAALDACDVDRFGAMHGYCHAVPDRWHVMGVMLSAGGALRWCRDEVWSGSGHADDHADPYDAMTAAAATVVPGCEGLTFLPYLTGERTPHADPLARGAFVGLTLRHHRAHLVRSVLEGVTFGLRDCLDLARGLAPIEKVRISGGGARSPQWRQMMADVFGCPVATVNVAEGAAFGAAVLAAVGGGAFRSVEEAATAIVRETGTTEPGEHAGDYEAAYERYRGLYPTLRGNF